MYFSSSEDATFEKQGFVGFWTKADAATRFGGVMVRASDSEVKVKP